MVLQNRKLISRKAASSIGKRAWLKAYLLLLCTFWQQNVYAEIDARPIKDPQTSAAAQLTSMNEALDQTLMLNPRVASARMQLGIVQAAMAQATVYPNGGLEMDNGFHAERTYRFGAFVPIEPPWKMALRVISAKKQLTAADLVLQQSLWLLRGEVRRAYTEYVIAEESFQTLQEITELTRVLANVAQKRLEAGDVPRLDLFKANLALAQAQADSQQGDRRILQAREQLNIVMGRKLESATAAPPLGAFKLGVVHNDLLPDLNLPLGSVQQYIDIALANRLELKIIDQNILVQHAEQKVAIGNIIPNAQISAGRSVVLNEPQGPRVNGWYMTGQFPLPMFNVNQGELKRFSSTIRQLRFEKDAQKNLISAQVDAAYRRLWNAREQMRQYQEHILDASDQVALLGQLSYKNGQSDITAALAAQQSNIQVRNQYLNAIMAYEIAFTDLEQAIGKVL